MKLELREKFSLEIPLLNGTEEIITGTIRELTKSEQKEIKDIFKEGESNAKILKKKARKLDRLNSIADKTEDNFNEIETLEDEIDSLSEAFNIETLSLSAFRKRFELTIATTEADKKDRLKQICEDFGYEKVFATINKDIEEKKPKE